MANEKRLIDASEFERYLMATAPEDGVCDDCLQYVTDELMTFPTVDAVEVVRCKECIFARFESKWSKYYCLHFPASFRYSNDFCSYGERRCDNG